MGIILQYAEYSVAKFHLDLYDYVKISLLHFTGRWICMGFSMYAVYYPVNLSHNI